MQVVFQSLQSIELFFADLVQNYLQFPENNVLLMYSQRGQVSRDINVDVCYISVTPEIDERQSFKNRENVYDEQSETYTINQQSSRTLYVSFVFYGPNSSENCLKISEMMYLNSTKLQLDKQYLYLVPERTEGPTLNRELYNSRWYRRSDLKMYFYNTVVIQESANTFNSVNINTVFNM